MIKANKIFILLLFVLASCSGSKSSQETLRSTDPTAFLHEFSQVITPDLLREQLFIVASDSFQGRGTGQVGIDIAADYIKSYYTKHGVTPGGDNGSYFQNFYLTGRQNAGIEFRTYSVSGSDTSFVSEGLFSNTTTTSFYPEIGGEITASGDVVFLGFGVTDNSRNINHYADMNLTNKWVLVFADVPYIVEGDTLIDPAFSPRDRFSEILFRKGAAGMILIRHFEEEEFEGDAESMSSIFGSPSGLALEYTAPRAAFNTSILSISPSKAKQMLGLGSESGSLRAYYENLSANPASFSPYKTGFILEHNAQIGQKQVPVKNIVGILEGSDPVLKNEYIVLSAHYDHMGIGQPDASGDMIYNGADDNGSGTVALMAIARAFNEAAKAGVRPKRSIIFLHVTAEEIGLLGSRYYSDYPTVPIENIVANLNMDMIGRIDDDHKAQGETDYVYIIGAEIISSDMNNRLNAASEVQGNQIRFDMRYNDLRDRNQFYRRSDHWNFGRLGIPFIFYFTGVHEDYHRPSDTPDKIYYDKYSKITRLIFSTTIEIANTPERPVVDSQEFIRITQSQAR